MDFWLILLIYGFAVIAICLLQKIRNTYGIKEFPSLEEIVIIADDFLGLHIWHPGPRMPVFVDVPPVTQAPTIQRPQIIEDQQLQSSESSDDDDDESPTIPPMQAIVDRQWRLARRLDGDGAFGCIVVARQIRSDQLAILKFKKHVADWCKEWRILFACRECKYVVHVFDAGEHPGADNWISMEKLDASLEMLRQQRPGNKFNEGTCLRIMMDVMEGLMAVHSAGYIHADLKAANLAYSRGKNCVKILDLGLARKIGAEDTAFVGTKEYASLRVLTNQQIGRNDDIENLIYVIFEMIIGELPWNGRSKAQIADQKSKIGLNATKFFETSAVLGLIFEQTIQEPCSATPKYAFFKSSIRRHQQKKKYAIDGKFEWEE